MNVKAEAGKILLIGHNESLTQQIAAFLEETDWNLLACVRSGFDALDVILSEPPDVVLLDIHLNGESSGLETLRLLRQYSTSPVILYGSTEDYSAFHAAVPLQPDSVILGSVDRDKLTLTLGLFAARISARPITAAATNRSAAASRLPAATGTQSSRRTVGFAGLVGAHPKMSDLYENVKLAATSDIPVFLEGETGTGKEMVAAAIHKSGSRADNPFVAINCGALTESIAESELFGHEKGSFTGAIKNRQGKFEAANNGTLFLDEVCELSLAVQVKLLRVLQENYLERVGSNKPVPINVRIICATNKDIREEVKAGRFRQDLYYRICVMRLSLPALRERGNDLDLLIEHFLKQAHPFSGSQKVDLSFEARHALHAHAWPGNIRELKNVMQYALLQSRGQRIELHHLPDTFAKEQTMPVRIEQLRMQRKKKLADASVHETLHLASGNKKEAARLLGVSRATLYRFLENPH